MRDGTRIQTTFLDSHFQKRGLGKKPRGSEYPRFAWLDRKRRRSTSPRRRPPALAVERKRPASLRAPDRRRRQSAFRKAGTGFRIECAANKRTAVRSPTRISANGLRSIFRSSGNRLIAENATTHESSARSEKWNPVFGKNAQTQKSRAARQKVYAVFGENAATSKD